MVKLQCEVLIVDIILDKESSPLDHHMTLIRGPKIYRILELILYFFFKIHKTLGIIQVRVKGEGIELIINSSHLVLKLAEGNCFLP